MTTFRDPLGFPIHALTDGIPQSAESIHRSVHERVRTHLLGQRTEVGIWPPHSANANAVDAYRIAHHLLYDSLDAVAAARKYEEAANIDSGYLQAWVGLALAWTSMGTPDSLKMAVELWRALVEIPVGDLGVSKLCMSILFQNLAYTLYQEYLYSNEMETLAEAANFYEDSHKLDSAVRPELYYPWCNVLILLERIDDAKAIWEMGDLGTPSPVKDVYLDKYTSLSAFDLRWSK